MQDLTPMFSISKQVFDALRELTMPLETPKRPIGFVTPDDKSAPKAIKAARGKTAL